MTFMVDVHEVNTGVVIFRRTDVEHRNWYCRVKVPGVDRYKVKSLKTPEISVARAMALEQGADLNFRIKHGIPVFNKTFAEVAAEFSAWQKTRADGGQINKHRWKVIDSYIRVHLNAYVGNVQITLIGQEHWADYPLWRQGNGRGHAASGRVSDSTIRDEMTLLRAIMAYAARKKYIQENQIPKDRIPASKVAREEFTRDEYRKLHTDARKWIEKAENPYQAWHRTMAYNFMLIMANTGMRPPEAKNLKWRDVSVRIDKQQRTLVILNVRGKGKFRSLVATSNVAEYLDRIRDISKATEPDDAVFSTHDGRAAVTLYRSLITSLLKHTKLLMSASGKRRSTYCFRHTYATFRLSEGVDSLFLAHQMGTSVKMIEEHYGHITPVKNAERILMGMPEWVSAAEAPVVVADVNARATEAPPDSDSP